MPFSCKIRGLCASCGAKRMAQQSAHLVDQVFPDVPVRQWVLTVPFALRPMVSLDRALQSKISAIFIEEIFRLLRGRFGDQAAAVSVIQRFSNTLNLHVHYHVLVVDGVWREDEAGKLHFVEAPVLSSSAVQAVSRRVAARRSPAASECDRSRVGQTCSGPGPDDRCN